jgi:hypothetical protein
MESVEAMMERMQLSAVERKGIKIGGAGPSRASTALVRAVGKVRVVGKVQTERLVNAEGLAQALGGYGARSRASAARILERTIFSSPSIRRQGR